MGAFEEELHVAFHPDQLPLGGGAPQEQALKE
jgi:hypothetical protein